MTIKFASTYAGKLVLPDGVEILTGETFDADKALAENAGVKSWLDDGLIEEVKHTAKK